MTTPDTKQAEKDYLTRTGSSAWEQSKPFSPPGSDTLHESASMLHDFAVAMLTLQPSPDDLILDLGAGGCWCSDLLGRLNRSAIAVDISLDMLRAGRSRAGTPIRASVGDMEALPFKPGVFQKAVCLSAIHHVPNIAKAVAEVARVLTPDGMAVFSEPGEGHAEASVSTAAVHAYGVLEQDILVGPFMRYCLEAGFEEVHVQPLAVSVPAFGLTIDDWDAWSRLAASTRPRRALAKLVFALGELFGLGKKNALFEEALAISMVRTVRQVVAHHPVIVARKSRAGVAAGDRWRASIEVDVVDQISRDSRVPVTVTATNLGSAVWRTASSLGVGHVTLGIQLLDESGRLLSRDYHRVMLPQAVEPGQAVPITFTCPVPAEAGMYRLKFDLVAEGVTWFELAGSVPVSKPLRVV